MEKLYIILLLLGAMEHFGCAQNQPKKPEHQSVPVVPSLKKGPPAQIPFLKPSFWESILMPLGGNIKVGIHGDMSNVASGNLESRGSIGISINGHDMSIGGKIGASGNLGQGLTNGASVGLGGAVKAKPSFTKQNPNAQNAQAKPISNSNTNTNSKSPFANIFGKRKWNSNGNNGNWQKMKEYFKFFVENGKAQ